MKQLLHTCTQPRPYANSVGVCLVKLEGAETIKDVEDKYINVDKEWYETQYSNARLVSEYANRVNYGEYEHFTGNLVLMKTEREYAD